MKKSLLALAVLGAFAGAASAQSSVTIWGVVDLSANDIKNGTAHTQSLASNQLNSNRLGFRGVEDLGGGMQARFWLEAGMNNGTGVAGGGSGNVSAGDVNSISSTTAQLFNRRSTVSLAGDKWGEIRVGRDYDPSFWNTVFFDVNGANGLGQGLNMITSLGSGAGTIARANNSIGYFLPGNLGGLYGQAMVAAGQGTPALATATTGALASNKYYGGRLGFAAGPFDVAVGYGITKVPTNDFKMANVGGSWDFGVAKIYGFYNRNTFGPLKNAVYEFSVGVPIGQGELRGVYGHEDASGSAATDPNDANLYSIEYVYNLSKRTALYATAAQIKNKGAAAFTVLPGTPVAGTAPIKSTGLNFGIRHSF